jgi:hypothetical protein
LAWRRGICGRWDPTYIGPVKIKIKGKPTATIAVLRWTAMRRYFIAAVALAVAACSSPQSSHEAGAVNIVLLTRDGCANTDVLRTNLEAALQSLAAAPDYEVLDLARLPAADVRRGYPTPTLLYANRDLFGLPEPRPPLPEPT